MMSQPLDPIEFDGSILDLCAFPTRNCALFITDSNKKSNTRKDFLKEIAIEFANDYKFFEIDSNCNQELF